MFKVIVVNQSSRLSNLVFQQAVRAINMQLRGHFGPAWNINCSCGTKYKKSAPPDAYMYIMDEPTIDNALGYHDVDEKNMSQPVGYVFLNVCDLIGENFSKTLSHEMCELVLNRHCNYYAIGTHPRNSRKKAAIWLEACDAVQDQGYEIYGVEVSDFLFPHYFTPKDEEGSRNNFLIDKPVASFGVNPGGYIGYYDFDLKIETTFMADDRASKRHEIKNAIGMLRRKNKVTSQF